MRTAMRCVARSLSIFAVLGALLASGCGDPGSPGSGGDGAAYDGGPVDGWLGGDEGGGSADEGPPVRLSDEVTFTYELEPVAGQELDTGWVPPSSDIQLRFVVRLASRVAVSAPGTAWVEAGSGGHLTYVGEQGAGLAEMDIGFQISGRLRINLSVPILGSIDWEGDLPLNPAFDLRFADQQGFTPFLLEGAADRPVLLSDTVAEKQLFRVPISGLNIPLVGGGEVVVLGQGKIDAAITGHSIESSLGGGAPLIQTSAGQEVPLTGPLAAPAAGSATYRATIAFSGGVKLRPGIAITALGNRWTVARFPLAIDIGNLGLADGTMVFGPEPLELTAAAP